MGFPRSVRLAAALALGCLLVLVLAGGTQARSTTAQASATCDPTTTNDGQPDLISLRDCVIQLNDPAVGGGTITLNPIAGENIFTLSLNDSGTCDGIDREDAAATGDLDIKTNITIDGNGATIDALSLCNRIFDVQPGATLTLDNLTLEGGFVCVPPPATSGTTRALNPSAPARV